MPIARAAGRAGTRSKYRAVRTVVHGFTFASKAEARRYSELLLLGLAGEIRNLELQPRFPIFVEGERVAEYVGDFRYEERIPALQFSQRSLDRAGVIVAMVFDWSDVVEDLKGMKTPVYRLKKKLVEAQYRIQIRETR